jgi:hypothetical protein
MENKYLEKHVHSSNRHPLWAPDGQKVIFALFPFGGGIEAGGIYLNKADGLGTVEKLYTAPESVIIVPWSLSGDDKASPGDR